MHRLRISVVSASVQSFASIKLLKDVLVGLLSSSERLIRPIVAPIRTATLRLLARLNGLETIQSTPGDTTLHVRRVMAGEQGTIRGAHLLPTPTASEFSRAHRCAVGATESRTDKARRSLSRSTNSIGSVHSRSTGTTGRWDADWRGRCSFCTYDAVMAVRESTDTAVELHCVESTGGTAAVAVHAKPMSLP